MFVSVVVSMFLPGKDILSHLSDTFLAPLLSVASLGGEPMTTSYRAGLAIPSLLLNSLKTSLSRPNAGYLTHLVLNLPPLYHSPTITPDLTCSCFLKSLHW